MGVQSKKIYVSSGKEQKKLYFCIFEFFKLWKSETIKMIVVSEEKQDFILALLTKAPATTDNRCGNPKWHN